MKVIIGFLFLLVSVNLFANQSNDIKTLIEQNKELTEKIQKNNEMIQKSIDEKNTTTGSFAPVKMKSDNSLPSNIAAALSFGRLGQKGSAFGKEKSTNQLGAKASAQLYKNLWGEVGYATSNIKNFPVQGLDTKVENITAKLKYNQVLKTATLHLQPYAGYQKIKADSPGAGQVEAYTYNLEYLAKEEHNGVKSLRDERLIFGASLLYTPYKKFFVSLDIGNDSQGISSGMFF